MLTKSQEVKPNMLVLVLIFAFVFFILKPLFFPEQKNKRRPKKITEHYGTMYPLPYAMHLNKEDYYPKDSALLFSNNKCCKSCCKNLWPLPFDVDDCETCKDAKEKYVLSNYTCQGENGSGCVCVTKQEADLLDRRGNNKLVGPRVIFPYGGIEPVSIDDIPQPEQEVAGKEGEAQEVGEEQEVVEEQEVGQEMEEEQVVGAEEGALEQFSNLDW